jgi:transposase
MGLSVCETCESTFSGEARRGRQRHLRGLRPGNAGRADRRGARPKALAQLARARLRAKLGALQEAFVRRFSDHHAFLLQTMLSRIDQASTDIAELDRKIEEAIAPFRAAADRLDEICGGVGQAAAQVIIAEVGVDMSRFPTPGHLVSWARYARRVKESAGKRKGKGSRPARTRLRCAPPGAAACLPTVDFRTRTRQCRASATAIARLSRPPARSSGRCG